MNSNRGFRCSETRHLFSSFGSGSKERMGERECCNTTITFTKNNIVAIMIRNITLNNRTLLLGGGVREQIDNNVLYKGCLGEDTVSLSPSRCASIDTRRSTFSYSSRRAERDLKHRFVGVSGESHDGSRQQRHGETSKETRHKCTNDRSSASQRRKRIRLQIDIRHV